MDASEAPPSACQPSSSQTGEPADAGVVEGRAQTRYPGRVRVLRYDFLGKEDLTEDQMRSMVSLRDWDLRGTVDLTERLQVGLDERGKRLSRWANERKLRGTKKNGSFREENLRPSEEQILREEERRARLQKLKKTKAEVRNGQMVEVYPHEADFEEMLKGMVFKRKVKKDEDDEEDMFLYPSEIPNKFERSDRDDDDHQPPGSSSIESY